MMVVVLASACTVFPPPPDAGVPPDAGTTGCQLGFAGDRGLAPELVVTVLDPVDGRSRDLAENDGVPLMFPPQGGRVVFAGVRANNVHACGAEVQGALRDPGNQQVRLDKRTTNLRRLDGGWVGSVDTNTATFANIPVCPNQWSDTSVHGNSYQLEMRLTDREGRTVSQSLRVQPYCAEPANEAECRCICQQDYTLGMSCVDGGMPADGGG